MLIVAEFWFNKSFQVYDDDLIITYNLQLLIHLLLHYYYYYCISITIT